MNSPDRLDKIAAEAAERFALTRRGLNDAAQQADLEAWLQADAEHRAAFEDTAQLWADLDGIRSDPTMLFLRESAVRELRQATILTRTRAVAAVLVACAALVGLAQLPKVFKVINDRQAEAHALAYRTAVGQIAEFKLADGSVATLDTNSSIRFWQVKDARFVQIVQGRARFKVSKNPSRPFSVLAGGSSVTALGTQFDVYLRPDGLRVTLMEGRLRVAPEAEAAQNKPAIHMTAGYQLTATRTGWSLAQTQGDAEVAWTNHRLVFENAPVRDIVAELNRYSSRQVAIADPAIGDKLMSAVLETDDTQTFLTALSTLHVARARAVGAGYELEKP